MSAEGLWAFDSDAYIDEINAEDVHAREMGMGGVPGFILNRQFFLSGAQPVAAFAAVRPHSKRGGGLGTRDRPATPRFTLYLTSAWGRGWRFTILVMNRRGR